MRLKSIFAFVALPPLLAIACSSSSSSPATGGDASADAGGGSSSGTSGSSGTSSGSSGSSGTSGTSGSSGSSGSSGTSGSSGSSGSSGNVDSGQTCPTAVDFAKCVEADAGTAGNPFQDFGATDALVNMVTGDYNAGVPSTFDIPCIKIKVGQKVTWQGNFTTHPLIAAPCNPAGNTIPTGGPGIGTAVLNVTTAGIYGFQCQIHTGQGMKGVIVAY